MASSPEHQFIAGCVGNVLLKYTASALFGVLESQRRTFDYSCILFRDLSRPLVSQVLWSHTEGIEKDIRTLLLDTESRIKLYLVKDDLAIRARLDEILLSYRQQSHLKQALGGLRLIFLPSGFDADGENNRQLMANYIENNITKDILFGVVFGQLTRRDYDVFTDHGSVVGLTYVVLDAITKQPLTHMPTFKEQIGYRTTGTIAKVLTMLNAIGMVRRYPRSNVHLSTVKGRLYLDLVRRVLFELMTREDWSDALVAVLAALGLGRPRFVKGLVGPTEVLERDPVLREALRAGYAKRQFGRDLLENVDSANPRFYSEYALPLSNDSLWSVPGFSASYLNEPDSLFYPQDPRPAAE